jgi:hypothetical protein
MCSLVVKCIHLESLRSKDTHYALIFKIVIVRCERTTTLYYSFIIMSMNVFLNLTPSGTYRTASPLSRFGD